MAAILRYYTEGFRC